MKNLYQFVSNLEIIVFKTHNMGNEIILPLVCHKLGYSIEIHTPPMEDFT